MLTLKRAGDKEAETLHWIQSEAFHEDLKAYQDFATNPACETLDQMLQKIRAHDYYAIYWENEIIGGAAVQHKSENHYRISPIYLNPIYHNKGYGSQIIKSLLSLYPSAQIWTLSTPKPSARNGHFYEKFGFVPVGEQYINERLTLTHYRKEIQ